MNLLAVDTATEACSAALWVAGEVLLRYQIAPRRHAALLLPMIDELLAEAGLSRAALDGVVYGRGPGSFTGVRIAVATAQGIALGLDCGVVGISTLQALAHRAWRECAVTDAVTAIDARMGQVYCGSYQTGAAGDTRAVTGEMVGDAQSVELPSGFDWIGAGSGFASYGPTFLSRGVQTRADLAALFPSADDVVMLGQTEFAAGRAVGAEQAAPVYLREKVALTEAERVVR